MYSIVPKKNLNLCFYIALGNYMEEEYIYVRGSAHMYGESLKALIISLMYLIKAQIHTRNN